MREQLLKAMRGRSLREARQWFDRRLIDFGPSVKVKIGGGMCGERAMRFLLRLEFEAHGRTRKLVATCLLPLCALPDEVDERLTRMTAAALDEMANARATPRQTIDDERAKGNERA